MLGGMLDQSDTNQNKNKSDILINANDLQSHLATVLKSTGLVHHPSSSSSAHHSDMASPRSAKKHTHLGKPKPPTAATAHHNKPANGSQAIVFGAVEKSGGGCLRLAATTKHPKQQQQAPETDMAVLIREQQISQAPRYTGCRNDKAKPPYSYASLIAQALLAAPNKRLTLASIYAWIMDRYPYYRSENCGWQNSIRHNLSLNRCFVRIARDDVDYYVVDSSCGHDEVGQEGKGAFWTIDEALMDDFEDGMFKRRKYGQGRMARRQSGEERRRRRRVSVDASDTQSVDANVGEYDVSQGQHVNIKQKKCYSRKLTIEDALYGRASNPIIGLFAPSPGISSILLQGIQRFDNEDDDLEEEWFVEDEHMGLEMEDPFTHIAPVAYPQFTCPELAESRYVYPMPPTFSDFYH